jgi:trehalose 6-phosphate phosphatase
VSAAVVLNVMTARPVSIAPEAGAFPLRTHAFLLDVDGTILDIAPTPEDVDVPESLKHALSRLKEQTAGATALVSGRAIDALDSLFAPVTLAAVGCHGAEWRTVAGGPVEIRAQPLPPEVKHALLAVLAATPQIRVEDKGYTLAFHYRRAPDLGPELEKRLTRAIASMGPQFRLLHGKLVIEVKSRSFDKGEAVRALMQRWPFAGRRPVFLGDDTTDRDAFGAMRALGGTGISVGRPMAGAQFMLPDPPAARKWLATIVSGP